MKKVTTLLAAAAFVFAMASCNKCEDCDCSGTGFVDENGDETFEVCKKDADDKDDYEAALDLFEDLGCDCK